MSSKRMQCIISMHFLNAESIYRFVFSISYITPKMIKKTKKTTFIRRRKVAGAFFIPIDICRYLKCPRGVEYWEFPK